MKEIYNEMKADYYRGFPISKEEQNAINKWQKNHLTNHHNLKTLEQKNSSDKAIEGNFKFEFIPTSVGIVGNCICGNCQNRARRESNGDYKIFEAFLKKYDAKFEFQIF